MNSIPSIRISKAVKLRFFKIILLKVKQSSLLNLFLATISLVRICTAFWLGVEFVYSIYNESIATSIRIALAKT
jgi:hypothetical protein